MLRDMQNLEMPQSKVILCFNHYHHHNLLVKSHPIFRNWNKNIKKLWDQWDNQAIVQPNLILEGPHKWNL